MKQTTKQKVCIAHTARHPSRHDGTSLPFSSAAKALLITLGASLLLLLAASVCAYFYPDPDRLIMPLGLGVTALISFFGGYITLVLHRHSALLCGLLYALLLTLLMLPLMPLLSSRGTAYPLWAACILRTSVFALSVAGAFCAMRRLERAPKKKRRKHT